MHSDSWWVEGNYSGGSRSGSMLFTESKNSLNMGYVTWNVYGGYGDNMGFAGYTRPIWTPDPCFEQPLYSKNCSNFDAEIKRLADEQNKIQKASLDQTVANISTTSPTPSGSVTNTVTDANTSTPTVSTTTTVTATDTSSTTNNSPKTSSISTSSVAEVVAPRTESKDSNSSSSSTRNEVVRDHSSTSFALNLISKNQERETNISMQASQNAIKEGEQRGMQSMRQAEKMVMDQIQKNNQNNGFLQEQITSSIVDFKPQNQSTSFLLPSPPVSTSVVQVQVVPNFANAQISQQSSNTSNNFSESVINASSNQFVVNAPILQQNSILPQQTSTFAFNNNQQNVTVALISPVNIQQQFVQQNINSKEEQIKYEVKESSSIQTNFVTDKTNPVTELVDNSKPIQVNTTNQTSSSAVKTNVQDNDAAAGVSINNIARTPVGFNSYMVALSDSAFYAPKEIYRNQKNVDNARALRQLASDRLHQQMVDQQYLPR